MMIPLLMIVGSGAVAYPSSVMNASLEETTTAVSSTHRPSAMARIWMKVDSIYENITTQEAERAGRTVQEHTDYCIGRRQWIREFPITKEEWLMTNAEVAKIKPEIEFRNEEELALFIRELAPHTNSLWMRVKAFVQDKLAEYHLDSHVVNFFREASHIEPEALKLGAELLAKWQIMESGRISLLTKLSWQPVLQMRMREIADEVIAKYNALPDSSKSEAEKHLCLLTYTRTCTEIGDFYLNMLFWMYDQEGRRMVSNGILTLTTNEVWPASVQDLFTYQVDDGTIFYYSPKNSRLFVKWKKREIEAKLSGGFGIREITAFFPHGNALYFEANRKIYRAYFVPPDAIAISFVRNLLESEKPRRNGLCHRDKFVHRICDDPARGGILVDVSEQESRQLRLEGLHRGKTLYNQFSYETLYPSARKIGENAIAIVCNGTLYSHRDSSTFIYISCGSNLFTLDTAKMTFLPNLAFGPDILIHSIVGVYNGVITVTGKRDNQRELMSAELPEGYFEWSAAYHGELEAALQKENRELKKEIGEKAEQLKNLQVTMDKFRNHTDMLKQQVNEMSGMLAKTTFRLD